MEENIDYVQCKICGKTMLSLIPHLPEHGLNKKIYQQIFSNSITLCEKSLQSITERIRIHDEGCNCCRCKAKRGEAYNKGLRGRKLEDIMSEEKAKATRQKHKDKFKDEKFKNEWRVNLSIGQTRRHKNMSKAEREELNKKITNGKIDWDFFNKYGTWKSKYPYSYVFNKKFEEEIRKRDNYTCQVTGITQEEHIKEYGCMLHVHHWTYDKDATNPYYFVTVCKFINCKANYNRQEWLEMFNGIMEDKYCMELENEENINCNPN